MGSGPYRAQAVLCGDCGKPMLDVVRPGHHSLHWRDGKLLNCVGKEVP